MLSDDLLQTMIERWGNFDPEFNTIIDLCRVIARASAASERERCAKLCDEIAEKYMHSIPMIDAVLTTAQVEVAIECKCAIRQQSAPPPARTGMQRETTE